MRTVLDYLESAFEFVVHGVKWLSTTCKKYAGLTEANQILIVCMIVLLIVCACLDYKLKWRHL